MLGLQPDPEALDDPVGARTDHVDRVAEAVWHVHERLRIPRRPGQHVRAVEGVDIPGRGRPKRGPAARRARAAARRLRPVAGTQLAQGRLRPRRPPAAGEQDPHAERYGREIRARRGKRADPNDVSGLQVDGDDPRRQAAEIRASTADHVDDLPDRCGGRMGRRRRQPPDPNHTPARRVGEHRLARGAVLERAAGDHEPAVDARDRRVAQREGQPGDDPRLGARSPGDDRVQPAAAREAADDVGGIADRGRRLVGARRRQAAGDRRRPAARRDAQDDVALGVRAGAAAEQVHVAPEADRGRVVQRRRQVAGRAITRGPGDPDVGPRRIGRRQPAEQHDPVPAERGRRRVLNRRREPTRRHLDQPKRASWAVRTGTRRLCRRRR